VRLAVSLSLLLAAGGARGAGSAGVAGGEGNRLWRVRLEVRGPLDSLVLECGPSGRTVLTGPFPAGEQRELSVAVPVESPLGVEGLELLPLPELRSTGSGSARLLGWSPQQPGGALGAAPGLLSRPRPPLSRAGAPQPRAGALGLLLLGVVGALLLGCRKRPALFAGLSLLAGGLAFFLAPVVAGDASGPEVLLLEVDPGGGALRVEGARDELVLDAGRLAEERLELSPPGGSLELLQERDARLRAHAPGRELYRIRPAEVPRLVPAANDWEPLEQAWTRTPDGTWTTRGPWPLGSPLPDARPGDGPPGWLAAGLTPGRGVLLGRSARGAWLREVGFPLESSAVGGPPGRAGGD